MRAQILQIIVIRYKNFLYSIWFHIVTYTTYPSCRVKASNVGESSGAIGYPEFLGAARRGDTCPEFLDALGAEDIRHERERLP